MTRNKNVRRYNADDPRPPGMAAVTLECLLMGIDLGWEPTEMRNGQIQLRREHEGSDLVVMLPTNQRSIRQSVSDGWMRKIIRYGDPMKRLFMESVLEEATSPDPLVSARGMRNLQNLKSFEIIDDPATIRRYLKRESNGQATAPEPEKPPEPEPPPEPPPLVETSNGPHITKIRPWIAKHRMSAEGGQVYESKAVLERKWSDGTMDYLCSMCEFIAPLPRTVAAHYGGKHGREFPAKLAEAESYLDPAIRWTPSERQAGRIARLAKEMNQAWEEIGEGMTAQQCAEWIVRKRDAERDLLVDDATPMTSEQVIERVRKLVDGGAYADLLARIETVEAQALADVATVKEQMTQHDLGATNAVRILEQRLVEQEMLCEQALEAAALAQDNEREAIERWEALRSLVNT